MRFIYAVFLGVVEGLTEWLPVSSTGHLILVNGIVKSEDVFTSSDLFLYVIQLGAILAVLTVFFDRLNPFSKKKTKAERKKTVSLWGKIAVACVPAAAVGLLLDDLSERFFSWQTVAAALFVYGVAFCLTAKLNMRVKTGSAEEINIRTALAIGAFQTLSIVPGTSRSGSTILGGMIAGCSREAAAEFSFFLAIPVMFGVSALKIAKNIPLLTGENILVLLVGAGVAYFVSLFTVKFLTGFVKKHSFFVFGVYRIALAAAVTLFFLLRG
ncbi:MAG: undecaprenyl-diphosphate phosphatase [Clostridia bacterium]|nr:undecaprenyl-diphosphate phosphatase [Clostridia bacterium]